VTGSETICWFLEGFPTSPVTPAMLENIVAKAYAMAGIRLAYSFIGRRIFDIYFNNGDIHDRKFLKPDQKYYQPIFPETKNRWMAIFRGVNGSEFTEFTELIRIDQNLQNYRMTELCNLQSLED